MLHFSTAQDRENFDFIAVREEFLSRAKLHVVVMIFDLVAHLNFFNINNMMLSLGFPSCAFLVRI